MSSIKRSAISMLMVLTMVLQMVLPVSVGVAAGIGGWESIVVVPNGDGTVSFMDSRFKKYMTVNE